MIDNIFLAEDDSNIPFDKGFCARFTEPGTIGCDTHRLNWICRTNNDHPFNWMKPGILLPTVIRAQCTNKKMAQDCDYGSILPPLM